MATQAHGEPEGILAHQLAHLFFILSMGVLIYWLRERNLVVEKAWRCIQYSALFFILWNLDTILAHLIGRTAEAGAGHPDRPVGHSY